MVASVLDAVLDVVDARQHNPPRVAGPVRVDEQCLAGDCAACRIGVTPLRTRNQGSQGNYCRKSSKISPEKSVLCAMGRAPCCDLYTKDGECVLDEATSICPLRSLLMWT